MAFVNLKKFLIPVEVNRVSEKSVERSAETSGETHHLFVKVPLFQCFKKEDDLKNEDGFDKNDLHIVDKEEAFKKLTDGFRALIENETTELRIDFGPLFTLFLKIREDSSKLLIAHPEENEYVGTAILTKMQMKALFETILEKSPVDVDSLGRFTKTSNLKLRFI